MKDNPRLSINISADLFKKKQALIPHGWQRILVTRLLKLLLETIEDRGLGPVSRGWHDQEIVDETLEAIEPTKERQEND